MFERELVLFRFVREYYDKLTADLTDADLPVQPSPGLNTPGWILGHLAIANDFTLRLLGHATVSPAEWMQTYGPGSSPVVSGALPSKAEFVRLFHAGHDAIVQALPSASPQALAEPHGIPIAFIESAFRTKAELVAHLLTTHPATHLGQLSVWRRLHGRAGVLTL